jgi:hypothetical protein
MSFHEIMGKLKQRLTVDFPWLKRQRKLEEWQKVNTQLVSKRESIPLCSWNNTPTALTSFKFWEGKIKRCWFGISKEFFHR